MSNDTVQDFLGVFLIFFKNHIKNVVFWYSFITFYSILDDQKAFFLPVSSTYNLMVIAGGTKRD